MPFLIKSLLLKVFRRYPSATGLNNVAFVSDFFRRGLKINYGMCPMIVKLSLLQPFESEESLGLNTSNAIL